ncbi:MAG TPA: peptide chain release factor N(5)-glutamine methyltransferase, partial [bacterium]|nr:peptide chain release factor N(5)-glutamine methyltransferase [bacterium]
MNDLEKLYRAGICLLKEIPQSHIDAKLILLHCFGLTGEDFFKNPEIEPPRKDIKRYFRMLKKRSQGYPLSYLTGIKEFWSIPFIVEKGVLIPRPETESIVETALAFHPARNSIIADIGTGCGNIAISMAKEVPEARIFATDISQKALRIARKNARMQGTKMIKFLQGDLFDPLKKQNLTGKIDFILSNPPYVSNEDWEDLPAEIKLHEPKRALVGGDSGLDFIQRMVSSASRFLKPGGFLIFEIGYSQKERVFNLFNDEW